MNTKTHSSTSFDLQARLNEPIPDLDPEQYDAAHRRIQRLAATEDWPDDQRRLVLQRLGLIPSPTPKKPRR